jgi:phage FluMu gp28-like protein
MNWLSREKIQEIRAVKETDNEYLGKFVCVPLDERDALIEHALAALEAREVMEIFAEVARELENPDASIDDIRQYTNEIFEARAWLAKHGGSK